jgi:hypothetical protein
MQKGVSAISLNQKIYSLGGNNGHIRLKTCEKYDLINNEWTFIADMNTARSNFAAEVLK